MKYLPKPLVLALVLEFILQACANQGTPTGGPRDTIPPYLLESNPINGQTNFRNKEFTLVFSEIVSADQLSQKLITTPKSDFKFRTFAKKNRLTIKFEEDFKDSTTYYLNFADGVVDITEKNPVENLSIAFSTGDYIDSMRVDGMVNDLFSQEPASKFTVGLYPFSDSLDLLRDNPVYFTTTDDSGAFSLNYVKVGLYKLLTFEDDNKNVIFDAETESHGFYQGVLSLDSPLFISQPINTLLLNVEPIKYINNRSIGPYIELKYNKEIDQYIILPEGFDHNIIGENKDGIRIYKPSNVLYNDSIQFFLTVYDSLNNSSVDTIKNVFQDNYRKPTNFNVTLSNNQKIIADTNRLILKFNKPAYVSDTARLFLSKDSTFQISPDYQIHWNENRTAASITFFIKKDSILNQIKETLPKDTTSTELEDFQGPTPTDLELMLEFPKNLFYSIEDDTSKLLQTSYRFEESKEYGTVKFFIATEKKSFFTQLLDKSDNVVYSAKNLKEPVFRKVEPGKYKIRILIDTDQNGIWSPGNLLQDIVPEPIYIHPEGTTVRENWEQEINISF